MDKKEVFFVNALNVKALHNAKSIVCDTSGFQPNLVPELCQTQERRIPIFTTPQVLRELVQLTNSTLQRKKEVASIGLHFVYKYHIPIIEGSDRYENALINRLSSLTCDSLFMFWVKNMSNINRIYNSIQDVVNQGVQQHNWSSQSFHKTSYMNTYRIIFEQNVPLDIDVIRYFVKESLEDITRQSPILFDASVRSFENDLQGYHISRNAFDGSKFKLAMQRFVYRLVLSSLWRNPKEKVLDFMIDRWQLSEVDKGVLELAHDRNNVPQSPVALLSADTSIEDVIRLRNSLSYNAKKTNVDELCYAIKS